MKDTADIFDRVRQAQQGRIGGAAADAKAARIAASLGRKREAFVDVAWPGGSRVVRIEILSSPEMADAVASAADRLAQKFGDRKASALDALELRKRAQMTEIVARAVKDPETGDRLFDSVDTLELARVTDDEVGSLWMQYDALEQEIDPDPSKVEPEVLAAFVDAAKKKDAVTLRRIASDSPITSLPTLVEQLVICLTGKSSSIEQ